MTMPVTWLRRKKSVPDGFFGRQAKQLYKARTGEKYEDLPPGVQRTGPYPGIETRASGRLGIWAFGIAVALLGFWAIRAAPTWMQEDTTAGPAVSSVPGRPAPAGEVPTVQLLTGKLHGSLTVWFEDGTTQGQAIRIEDVLIRLEMVKTPRRAPGFVPSKPAKPPIPPVRGSTQGR